jgi:outer membrane protein assembly factor BamE (lipoprotein component of BamABCDE complex)
MNMRTFQRAALLAAIGASTLLMSGCLVNSSSKTYQSGNYIGRSTLEQFEPGRTNEAFVLATLGKPNSRTDLGDRAELLRWEYTRQRSSSGGVFLLLSSSNHTETRTTTYVMLRDGIVERAWQD